MRRVRACLRVCLRAYVHIINMAVLFPQMDKRNDPSSVDIKKVLLDMRRYRMGLIQTPDQLRFSYMAVLEGAKCIMGDSLVQVRQDISTR